MARFCCEAHLWSAIMIHDVQAMRVLLVRLIVEDERKFLQNEGNRSRYIIAPLTHQRRTNVHIRKLTLNFTVLGGKSTTHVALAWTRVRARYFAGLSTN